MRCPDTPIKGKVVRADPALVTVDGSPCRASVGADRSVEEWHQLLSGMTAAVGVIAGEAKSAGPGSGSSLARSWFRIVRRLYPATDGQLKLTPVTVGLKDLPTPKF